MRDAILLVTDSDTPGESEDPPLVFLLWGQSNATAIGQWSDLAAGSDEIPANVKFWYGGSWTDVVQGSTFGPEVGIAKTLGLYSGFRDRQIRIIRYAVGGTGLPAWDPTWTEEEAAITDNVSRGPLYTYMATNIGNALAALGDYEWGGMFGIQGERDSIFSQAASEYDTRLAEFFAAIRSDYSATMKIVFCRIKAPVGTYPYVETVRAKQAAYDGNANEAVIDTDDFVRDDGVHIDSMGIMHLGIQFAGKYLAKFQEGMTVAMAGKILVIDDDALMDLNFLAIDRVRGTIGLTELRKDLLQDALTYQVNELDLNHLTLPIETWPI